MYNGQSLTGITLPTENILVFFLFPDNMYNKRICKINQRLGIHYAKDEETGNRPTWSLDLR